MAKKDEWGLTEQDRQDIRDYMEAHWRDAADWEINDVNSTTLAEDCAWNMDGGDDTWLNDETHPVWEIAVEVAEKYTCWINGQLTPEEYAGAQNVSILEEGA